MPQFRLQMVVNDDAFSFDGDVAFADLRALADDWFHAIGPPVSDVIERLTRIEAQGVTIMAKVDELEAELVAANTVTNEIAADIDDILAQLSGGVSAAEADALKVKLQEHVAALQAVAAKHTPSTP